jgi:hypothetical protein
MPEIEILQLTDLLQVRNGLPGWTNPGVKASQARKSNMWSV